MAIFRPGLLHLQISHDRRLAGVDADGVEPAGDPLVVADRHLARRRDEGDAVAALALDGKDALAGAGPARLIDLLGEVAAGVDAGDGDLQAAAVFELVDVVDHVVESLPDLRGVWPAHDVALDDAPRLAVLPVADYLVFEAVVLSVDAAGQHEHAVRQLHRGAVRAGAVVLTAGEHGVLVLEVAAIFPQLAEQGVVDDLEALRVILGVEELEDDLLPRSPRAREGIEPKRTDAFFVGVRVVGDPLGRLLSHDVLGDQAAAGRAAPRDAALEAPRLFPADPLDLRVEMDIVEHDLAVLPALGTAVAPAFLRALVKTRLDVAVALDGRGRDLDRLRVVECGLTCFGQRPRVALGAGAGRPAVALVADDVAGGRGGQSRGAVGAGQGEHTARERLLEDRVAAVLGLDVVHLRLQGLAVADHGGHAEAAELSGVVDGRVDVEDAAGVLVDDVADDVELELGLADLRSGYHDYFVHLRIRKGPHGLLEVRGALGAPRAGLG